MIFSVIAPILLIPENEMSKTDNAWDVVSIRERIAEYVEKGTISSELASAVSQNGYCAPLEFELLDYKETIGGVVGIERIVKAIISMHNTYGGYLMFGVGDARNGMGFPIVGIDSDIVNVELLKDRHHNSDYISITRSERACVLHAST